jgi:purine nucleosidase
LRRFLIDTDTASDDAVALIMALQDPAVQVKAITVVAGNVPLDQGVQNALYTVELCKKQVPVYRGASTPLLRELESAQYVHGEDGFGDIGLPLSGRMPAPGNAIDVIVETINRFPGEITLVCLAPLTNIAMALIFDRSLARKVKECVIMGGNAQGVGNVTPVAEYNIWVDPEAAKIVFESGMPVKMVDWYVSARHATLSPDDAEIIRNLATPLARFSMDIQAAHAISSSAPLLSAGKGSRARRQVETPHINGFVLADPLAMAVALDSAVATESKRLFVAVETESSLCRGQTVVDHLGVMKKIPNVEVVLNASQERFLHLMYRALK